MQWVNFVGMGRIKPRFDVEIVLKNFMSAEAAAEAAAEAEAIWRCMQL